MKPLRRKTRLKSFTPLKSRKGLNKMSQRTKDELIIWRNVKLERMQKLIDKFGFIPCEYCGKPIVSNSEIFCAEGHHNNHNRRDNTFENCRILHRLCNQLIEDKNIKDVKSLL